MCCVVCFIVAGIRDFREELINSEPPTNFKILVESLTEPEGVVRKDLNEARDTSYISDIPVDEWE